MPEMEDQGCPGCATPDDLTEYHDEASARWRNRIVGHALENPEDLLANPLNWRIHPKLQQDALAAAIRDVGYIRSVTVNQRTGFVVDGHLRVILALRNGEPRIPVEYVDLSEAEEAEAVATLDPLSNLAVADADMMDELFAAFETADKNLEIMLEGMQTGAKISQYVPNIDPQTGLEVVDDQTVQDTETAMNNRFAEMNKAARDLMVEVQCPHCCEIYWMNRNELLNLDYKIT